MELINLFLFFLGVFVARKNLFYFLFGVFLFVFCYSRFVISYFSSEYVLGGPEWVFPGVGNSFFDLYSTLYLIVQVLYILFAFLVNERRVYTFSLRESQVFYVVVFIAYISLSIKSFLIFIEIYKNGYLSAVDMQMPVSLSLLSSSLAKPIVISLIMLSVSTQKKINTYNKLVFVFLLTMAFSAQRKDVVSLLLFYLSYTLCQNENKYKKLSIGLLFIVVMSALIFSLRESSYNFSPAIAVDLIWAAGASVNPGLFVIENQYFFNIMDSLGFFNTYFYCGAGRIISDVCVSPERLVSSGFLLEKISSHLDFMSETTFGGIGGNLVASLFVASGFNEFPIALSYFLYVLYAVMVVFFCWLMLNKIRMSVTSALFICQIIVASRYAFDGFIPAINQVFVAVFIDCFVLSRTVKPMVK